MKIYILFALMVFIPIFSKAQNDANNKLYNEMLKDSVIYSLIDSIPVHTLVDSMPDFPGGCERMMNFLSKNLKYPKEATENGIQGTVYVRFIVTQSGSIKEATILKGVKPCLNNEALRVIRLMPKWKSGILNGKPVNVYFTVPVKFVLQ